MEEKKKRKIEDETLEQYYNNDMGSVVSATTYTGLTPTPPLSNEEAMSYAMLYVYPHEKKSEQDEKKKSDKKKS